MHRPINYLLFAYLSGILWGYYCPFDRFILILIIIPLMISAGIALLFNRKLFSIILSLCTCHLTGNLFMGNILAPSLPLNHISRYLTDRKVVVEGIITRPPQIFPAKTRYVVLASRMVEKDREIPVTGKILLTDRRPPEGFGYGDVVRFLSRIRRPRNFNNPGSFDYARFLAFQDILVTASLDGKHKMVKVRDGAVNPLLYAVERYRKQIREFFSAELSSPSAEIATALITGDQSGIPEEMRDRFAITGVAHILAISGMNIGIIALMSMLLIKTICRCSTRLLLATDISKVAALATLVPVIGYCLIAGGGIATVRATVMVIVYLMAIIINRQDDLWNSLALAAFLILLYSPSSLFDCSFQLSFVSVAAIVYLNPRFSTPTAEQPADALQPKRSWLSTPARYTMSVLTVTLAAMLGTAPLVALYFNRCSPWGIPANLIVVPLIGFLVVPLGLLASLSLCCARPLALIIARVMEVLLNLSNSVVAFFAQMPCADYRITTPTPLELALYYSGLVLLFNLRRSHAARYGLAAVITALIINASCWYYHLHCNPHLRITSLDVGQGEATLLQLPRGKTMLIDGGGLYGSSFDIGSGVVAPLLWSKKIKHIDILVLSHPHPDHLNGLVSIIRDFTIGEVWTNGELLASDDFVSFEGMIAQRGIKKAVMVRGCPPQHMNGVAIEFLHPGQLKTNKSGRGYNDRMNNNSLVMRLTYHAISITFTGDIYAEAEGEIMEAFPGMRSTVLKIPHHGSTTSSTKLFIEMLKPRIGLLSVGRDNSFKLPHQDVIKRYEDAGCTVFRTDKDGAIALETDGTSLWIRTHLQKKCINVDLNIP